MHLSPRLTLKSIVPALLVILFAVAGSLYFSAENRAYRAYMNMRDAGVMDLQVIDQFIRSTETSGPEYYEALNLAATLDDGYLDQVVTLYAQAQILLHRAPAERILSLLPSDALKVNTAAGRIMSTSQFGREDPQRAMQLLEYSALRGDRDAAEYLAALYSRFNCPVGAATWARIANERERLSACARIPVEADRFTDDEWDRLVFNEASLKKAWAQGEVPVLKYPTSCALHRRE